MNSVYFFHELILDKRKAEVVVNAETIYGSSQTRSRRAGYQHVVKLLDQKGVIWKYDGMHFEIIGKLTSVETFATGHGIRELSRLNKVYGRGRWRKRKGIATVRLPDGSERRAELHWYESTGIGKKEFKIKRFIG